MVQDNEIRAVGTTAVFHADGREAESEETPQHRGVVRKSEASTQAQPRELAKAGRSESAATPG